MLPCSKEHASIDCPQVSGAERPYHRALVLRDLQVCSLQHQSLLDIPFCSDISVGVAYIHVYMYKGIHVAHGMGNQTMVYMCVAVSL